MPANVKRIVIVGGGISGLAAAYYLSRELKSKNLPAAITLVEADRRLGGTIVTEKQDGFIIEGGPDSFITAKPWAMELCRSLGIEDRLIPTRSEYRKVYVLHRGRLAELPKGVYLTVPTQVWPFATTSLISPLGKLRAAMDLVLPRRLSREDESLGSFVRRRLGKEILDMIAEPLMGGIYTTAADRLSIQFAFPQFPQLERKHRSLILGMMKQKRPASASVTSLFMTMRGGMSELVEVLRQKLTDVTIVTGAPVDGIERHGPAYRLTTRGGKTLEADILVLTVPAPQAAVITRGLSEDLSRAVQAVGYTSSATVAMGFPQRAVPRPLDATGFIIPRREGRAIMACTWTTSKFSGRAPEGHVLLRCFIGGAWDRGYVNASDYDLTAAVREELRTIMGITEPPLVTRIFRWPATNPLYEVGHAQRLAAIDRALKPLPGLYLSGAGYRGVGIPDCVRDAAGISRDVVTALQRP